MTSYLENKLELLNASQRKLDDEKRVIEEQIILEIKKNSALEMDGTIVKFETQINELKKYIDGNIMPDNCIMVLRFGKHNYTRKEQQEICRKMNAPKFITLKKFKDNISKINDITKKGLQPSDMKLVEIKPEIKVYDDIIPIFSTMIGIMNKQNQRIEELESKILQNRRSVTIEGAIH